MHVFAALPAAQKDRLVETDERSRSDLSELTKAQNATPANSAQPCLARAVEDDLEDMWDNMPI